MIDYNKIEKKWEDVWYSSKIFEAEANDNPNSIMITAAWPYVNTPQHIGHLRTYCTPDLYARFLRLLGYNVLYPMGFHATGTPVLGFAKRIASNDMEAIEELRTFHIPDEEIKKMSDPQEIISYFIPKHEEGWRRMGCSMDFRRKFISIDPLFSKMVEWQFTKLKEAGFLVQGRHPIGWCPNENNPVGQHDTKHDVQPEISEMAAIKFKDSSSDIIFPCATYRPETVYGVSNIFINPNVKYDIVLIEGEKYYISEEAAKSLSYQMKIEVLEQADTSKLLNAKAINPVTNEEVPVLPGSFVKPDFGTGIVMSVPAHAPFDYAALQKLGKQQDVPKDYKRVLHNPEEKDNSLPSLSYIEKFAAMDGNEATLEEATKSLYRSELRYGIMDVGPYKGMKVSEARDRIKNDLISSKSALPIYIIANEEPVYCRCNAKVVVKVVEDQWFINYGDKEWKKKAKDHLQSMKIYPEKFRLTFQNVIDWLDLRATERAQGLGTRFPFNRNYIIESLSDSTIYMMFYTFVHILKARNISPEQLMPEFFDYLIQDKGDPDSVSSVTGIDAATIKLCKESFEYWYRFTSRHSAPDLVPNHLAMYIFNHIAVAPEKLWPKQIVLNGFVNYEGQKMSKSLGNIIPAMDAMEKYGADPIRFIEIAGSDLDSDSEFSAKEVEGIYARNEYLVDIIEKLPIMESKEFNAFDYWLYSKLNRKIKDATAAMENFDLKEAYTKIYFDSINELKKYFALGNANGICLRDFIESITIMLEPIMPHVTEEFWSMLGHKDLIEKAIWPISDEALINLPIEQAVDMLFDTVEDISTSISLSSKIKENAGKKISEIRIILASEWKNDAYNMYLDSKNMQDVIKNDKFKEIDKAKLSKMLAQLQKSSYSASKILMPQNELLSVFNSAIPYIAERFGTNVIVEREEDSKSARAARALPSKPSIDLVWE
ncbi:MAG: leucine--tRNA ligase [Candidatus Micrarchaeia archaeon]